MASSVLATLRKKLRPVAAIFTSRRAALLFALGFASGLPLLLVGATLTAWMADVKVDLTTIGIFTLVGLPYAFKWTWAPLLDRYQLPWLGRRRGWLFATQVLLASGFAVMAALDPVGQPGALAVLAVIVSFLAASQDVVSDGYRAHLLSGADLLGGTTTFVLGYRLAMLLASAGALILADFVGWSVVYLVAAAFMGVGVVATVLAPEPNREAPPPRTLAEAVVNPFMEVFRRPGAALVLSFIVFYKLADALMLTMPFYLGLGFTKTEIGAISKAFGFLPTLLGIAAGGALAFRLGLRRALLVAGAATAAANISFALLAVSGKSYPMLFVAIGVDNFCGGLVNAPWLAFLASLCDRRHSATQYALFSAAAGLGARVLGASSGYLAKTLGWPLFFSGTVLAAAPGLILLLLVPRALFAPPPAPPGPGAPV